MSEKKGLNGAVKAHDGYGSVNRSAEDKILILEDGDEQVRGINLKIFFHNFCSQRCVKKQSEF